VNECVFVVPFVALIFLTGHAFNNDSPLSNMTQGTKSLRTALVNTLISGIASITA
jgi:hypothetical protein